MGSMPLALSVHNFISSVGADAGFASIIGLAVLVLLYFAHARETANLREEAAGLTQRLQQAEARVAQLSRVQPVAVAQAAQPIVTPPPSLTVAAFPFPPSGVGAPALAAATRVVPVATPRAPTPTAPTPPAPTPPAPTPPAPKPAVAVPALQPAMSAAIPAPPPSAPTAPEPEPEPEPESPASQRVVAPAPATVAGGNGSGRDAVGAAPVGAGPSPPPPRVLTRPAGAPAAARHPPPPLRPPAARRSSKGRRFALLIGALGILAVIAVLLIATSGGSGTKTSNTNAARTTNAPSSGHSRAAAAFSPASVTVAVLNGTATNQLAHTVGSKLAAVGYKEGALRTASNQTQTATVVAYLPGARNRTAALHVAAALKLGSASVQPIDQSTQQVACPPPQACTANVVVTVGADLATL
jgi:hypothetical protein